MFSPRTRGCSLEQALEPYESFVFPAHAGLFPTQRFDGQGKKLFSPRTRGCSLRTPQREPPAHVFPAHAGLFPASRVTNPDQPRFPRARGVVPVQNMLPKLRPCFPRACGVFVWPTRQTPNHEGDVSLSYPGTPTLTPRHIC